MIIKKATTKKSGTIAYQLYERNDLTGRATKKNPAMGVTIVGSEVITTSKLADDINHASSITQADVLAVLQAVGQHLADALLDGNRVELDHLGTFSLTLTCGNKRKEDHITSKDISVSRSTFERICECSRHTALLKLKELVKAGKLIAIGPKNQRQYIPG